MQAHIEMDSPLFCKFDLLMLASKLAMALILPQAPPMRIATIGAGYADGYRRSLQQIGKINVAGYICNNVGRIFYG